MAGKLPKGVRTISEAAKRRGRGGQYLKGMRIELQSAQRTPRSERFVAQEIRTMKKSRAAESQIEEVRHRQAMQTDKSGRELSRGYKPAAPKPAPKVSTVGRLAQKVRGLGGLGRAAGRLATPLAVIGQAAYISGGKTTKQKVMRATEPARTPMGLPAPSTAIGLGQKLGEAFRKRKSPRATGVKG